ncbi:unnamed protein product [Cuscuta europaea]|uniref:Uncharacterized protein n=1 Tax=Cuscuta europaea TaxID=41803 RepID=A0A9P1E0Z7_CUSEU|nr:unnamed protein product [Cuscuta europaea]
MVRAVAVVWAVVRGGGGQNQLGRWWLELIGVVVVGPVEVTGQVVQWPCWSWSDCSLIGSVTVGLVKVGVVTVELGTVGLVTFELVTVIDRVDHCSIDHSH